MEQAQIYKDFKMNGGLNSYNPPRNIGDFETPDCTNIKMLPDGGIESAKGYVEFSDTIRASSTIRGGGVFVAREYGKTFFMLALDNGTDTRVYAYDILANNATELSNDSSTNRLPAGLSVDFTVVMDTVYYSCTGKTEVYSWAGMTSAPPEQFYAYEGIIPFNTGILFSFKNRLGVASTRANKSEYILSAYRDTRHWDTAVGNTLGDLAYGNVPDSNTDQRITAVIPDAFGTLLILREKSVYVMIGESEGDWVTMPITVTEGCIAPRTAIKGNKSAYYLSQHGLEIVQGVQESEDANRFDSLNTTTITDGIKDKISSYNSAALQQAHAILYDDTYRLNIGGDVWVFDLKANNRQGALTNASVEGDVGLYFEHAGALYGVGKTDGKIYKLLTGYDKAGEDYTCSYSTKQTDFQAPRNLKNITGIRAYGEVNGDYNITCDVYVDGESSPSASIDLDFKDITPAAYYVITTGTATEVGAGYLDDSGAAWTVNAFAGSYLGLSDGSSYQIISNTATRIVIDGTPTAGTYAVAPAAEMFYTDEDDSDESWASLYPVSTVRDSAGDRRIDLRGKTARFVFYTTEKDKYFRIDGYEVKFELLPHSSIENKV